MSYFDTCPICGAHLDPGEECSCMVGLEQDDQGLEVDENRFEACI